MPIRASRPAFWIKKHIPLPNPGPEKTLTRPNDNKLKKFVGAFGDKYIKYKSINEW